MNRRLHKIILMVAFALGVLLLTTLVYAPTSAASKRTAKPRPTRTPAPTSTYTPTPTPSPTSLTPVPTQTLLWGAYTDLRGTGLPGTDVGMPPWEMSVQDYYEQSVAGGRRATIIHWGQEWSSGNGFETNLYEAVRQRGAIPMINWNPWNGSAVDPQWTLASIYNGPHDATIIAWAQGAAAWGYPLFVRMMDEMNGRWYPWAEYQYPDGTWYNGNQPGDFILAWRHIVDLFRANGATNAMFVFCPNEVWNASDFVTTPLTELYPGDAYVDWVAMDTYSWGYNPAKGMNLWQTPTEIIQPTYDQLLALAPTKPVMLGEFGASAYTSPDTYSDAAKADWITNFFSVLPTQFPNIRAIGYFETTGAVADGMDWSVAAAGPLSRAAYNNGLASVLAPAP